MQGQQHFHKDKCLIACLQYQPVIVKQYIFNCSFPPDIADAYNGDFDLQRLESYKAGLFEHVDSSLQQMLQELGSSTLHSLHHEACADITGCYQRVLEVSLAEAQQLSSQARLVKRGKREGEDLLCAICLPLSPSLSSSSPQSSGNQLCPLLC